MSSMILIKNFPNRAFAEQARDILERDGIICILKSPDVGIIGTSSSSMLYGVDLYVEEQNKEQAYNLLNALFDGI
ncbi:MAG: hypothetical protein AB7T22_05320 [Calditrichaceae bacterium]